eukprot:259354_1
MKYSVRNGTFDDPLWNYVNPIYKNNLFVMLNGGVKLTSDGTYIGCWCEFWRTMRRLKIPDKLVWTFPISDTLLQIYIVDCVMVRQKLNCHGTVRLKMRSIDYVAQLCGMKQSWSDNPSIWALMQYAKKRRPGKGSDTLPVTSDMIILIVRFILENKVFYNLTLTEAESKLKFKW